MFLSSSFLCGFFWTCTVAEKKSTSTSLDYMIGITSSCSNSSNAVKHWPAYYELKWLGPLSFSHGCEQQMKSHLVGQHSKSSEGTFAESNKKMSAKMLSFIRFKISTGDVANCCACSSRIRKSVLFSFWWSKFHHSSIYLPAQLHSVGWLTSCQFVR